MRLNNKLGPLKILNQHLVIYPTPLNLNYMYNWGSLAGIVLGSQIVTGILLAMHYVGHVDHAFQSVQHLMTDVPSGMILRYAHANGASLFFTVVYMHIFRGIYYSSGNQPREMVWITGVVILLLMIITAFIGYVLPWGQLTAQNAFETLNSYLLLLLPSYENLDFGLLTQFQSYLSLGQSESSYLLNFNLFIVKQAHSVATASLSQTDFYKILIFLL